MEDIAPDIFRRRLIIEGYYECEINEKIIRNILLEICDAAGLKNYDQPKVFKTTVGQGDPRNAGYDAFLPLLESGISMYVWSKQNFVSIIIFSCAEFDRSATEEFIVSRLQFRQDWQSNQF